jgi:hypothetical protein
VPTRRRNTADKLSGGWSRLGPSSSASAISKLILHFVSRHLDQDEQLAPHDLVRRMAGGEIDAVTGLARCKVRSGKRLEIRSIPSGRARSAKRSKPPSARCEQPDYTSTL